MLAEDIKLILLTLEAGDKVGARVLLRPLLREQPTADLWVLGAYACEDDAKAVRCLKRALALDLDHREAKLLLAKLQTPKSVESPDPYPPLTGLTEGAVNAQPAGRKRRVWRVGFAAVFLLTALTCSLFTMNMIGVINGLVGAVVQLSGGPTPVNQWNGVPLAQVQDAPLVIPPAQSQPLAGQNTAVLDPGYAHEYTFQAIAGEEVAIYVQFLSLDAHAVSRNVAVIKPDGSDATSICQRDHILQGDNGVTFICAIDAGGSWAVRVLGRDDQSIGVYFVGIERVSGM